MIFTPSMQCLGFTSKLVRILVFVSIVCKVSVFSLKFDLVSYTYMCSINANIPQKLPLDHMELIDGLSLCLIKELTSSSIFRKAKRFEVKTSTIFSTQVFRELNSINGSYRAVKIYKQQNTWGSEHDGAVPFSLATINIFCDCKFYEKETKHSGKCCRHVTGQLRRALFFSSLMS